MSSETEENAREPGQDGGFVLGKRTHYRFTHHTREGQADGPVAHLFIDRTQFERGQLRLRGWAYAPGASEPLRSPRRDGSSARSRARLQHFFEISTV